MSIELEDFETRVTLRALLSADFEAMVALQKTCFPAMDPWTGAQFQSQLARWEDAQIGIFVDGRLVASAAQLIVDSGDHDVWSDWTSLSSNGFLHHHDAEGDTLYGVELQVHPDYRGMKLSRRLYDHRKRMCRDRNLKRMAIGGRIPGYLAHSDRFTPAEYVAEVQAKRVYDPVLTAQVAAGFVLRELLEGYLPDDTQSMGYATSLEWLNLDYVRPRSVRRLLRATQPVRVSLVQYRMRAIASFEEFERQVEFFVDTASDYKADFVLFPELFTVQLLSLLDGTRPGHAARQLAEFTPRYLELFNSLATRYNVNVIGGSQFTVEDEKLFNVSYLFHRDGRIDAQKKIHITPSEAKWWGVQGGDSVEVFDTDRGKVAILICYDVEFPELGRIVSAKGASLLFVPYNTNDRYGHNRVRVCTQARCVENHLFAVTAGCVGNLPFVENADVHYAQSAVLTPSDMAFPQDGISAQADPNVETVVAHDLDLEVLRRHRRSGTVQCWNDRRTDLYRVHHGDMKI